MNFQQSLKHGQIGEGIIAGWLKERGQNVLPVYEKQIDTGKGPQFFMPTGSIVAPDMFVFPSMHWVEAKHKTVFTWHRLTRRWVTGIDLRHYLEYQEVAKASKRPVWLMFLHTSGTPDARDLAQGCPSECPTGLYAGELLFLSRRENHRSDKWGRSGMVYWAEQTLVRVSTVEELPQPVRASA